MFFGEYERTVDYKGRFTLPGHLLSDGDGVDWSRVMVIKGDRACLYVYDLQTWKAVLDEAYRTLDDDEGRLFMHRALRDAHVSDVDSMKRISVPAPLLEYTRVEKKIVIVGMFNRLELWSPEVWSEHVAAMEDIEIPSIADLSRARIREVS